jgi:hypothetical protein
VLVRYVAPPTISRMLDSDAFVRVVVGPLGSGKSSGCIMEIIRRAMEQAPSPDGIRRTRFAIVRNTYRELQDTTRKTFEQWVPDSLGRWDEAEFSFRMRFSDVDCEVLFRALDKPKDVKKVLSLELTGCYFNELREISKAVFDGVQGRVGRFPSKAQGGPTWFGVWADTNPWHTGHWGYKLFREAPEGFELFKQPGGRAPDAENLENLPAGYYERLCHGKDAEWISVYVDAEYGTSDVGAIFGAWLDRLVDRDGIGAFAHLTSGIHTSWDLGIGDAASIWFWRISDRRSAPDLNGRTIQVPDYLDHYANHGQGMEHYFGVLEQKAKERGFVYERHWLPHDARARTFQTGISTLEQFTGRYGARFIGMTPELSVADGISATRWMLEQPIRIHSRCEDARGLEALREYRYGWDDANSCFSKKPLHNWASNTSDAFRYSALVARYAGLLQKAPPAKRREIVIKPPTWDELVAEEEANRGRRRM